MRGLYQQLQEANTFNYSKFSLLTLKEVLDEVYTTERSLIRVELDNLKDITEEQFNHIKTLLYSELTEDYTLAKEIINNLKNN